MLMHMLCRAFNVFAVVLARVVRKVDNAIHQINHYPADSMVCFVNTYPLDSDIQPSNNWGQVKSNLELE